MKTDHTEFLDAVDQGCVDECGQEQYLMKSVLTDEQKQFLRDRGLTVITILNGRYGTSQELAVCDWMRSVNATLGGKFFTIV